MTKLFNRVKVNTATAGTGTITLGSAYSNAFCTFAEAGVANADVVAYVIEDGTDFEVGIGTYTSAGTTLSRDTVRLSKIAGTAGTTKLTLSGSAVVHLDAAKEDLFNLQPPQGRLTLVSTTPIMTTSQSAKTTVYYTPYVGRCAPLYDGSAFLMVDVGGELSQTTADTTKSPAAVSASSLYDIFIWNDAGTYRATRGPAWSSATTRGTGAGTSELVMISGIYLNANAITNGPTAQRGTYVGTILSNGSSQIDYIFGANGAGGTEAWFGIWNMYNRVVVATIIGDTTDNWTYGTSTWRAANASNLMRATMVRGLNEDGVSATYGCLVSTSASDYAAIGIGLDSTTSFSGFSGATGATGGILDVTAGFGGLPGLGSHYLQAVEYRVSGTITFFGDNGGTWVQNGLSVQLRL